jgi:hypothetical protein
MRNDRSRFIARNRWLCSAFFALGLASAAATALAQTPTPPNRAETGPPAPPERAPAAANPDPVEGVTVTGRRADTGANIPDDKKAEFDAEAAREAAFRDYRQSRPPLTPDDKGVSDPNDQSKDFPGLQSYLPK